MAVTRVLIIDDEKENVRYLRTILEENGFNDIHAAYDGVEGLQKATEVLPGLILLDLRMPKKSGIAVFNELKDSSQLKDIPVVILTGEGGFLKHLAELRQYHEDGGSLEVLPTEKVLERFIKSRPDAFLEKPVEPEMLMNVVRKILITTDEVRARRINEIDALCDQRLTGKVVFKGATFDIDEKNRLNIMASVVSAMMPGGGLPEGFTLRSSDNKDIRVTSDELFSFHKALTAWIYNIHKAAGKHKAALDSINSMEELEKYDIGIGWPGNVMDK